MESFEKPRDGDVIIIEPLNSIVFDGRTISGKRVNCRLFGGFCDCGGVMYQKAQFKNGKYGILVSECEKCWKNKALVFSDDGKVKSKLDVRVVDRSTISDFIRSVLSSSEFQALLSKASGKTYSYTTFSRAKKKLENMGIDIDKILGLF